MQLKSIIQEDFNHYKKVSMVLVTPFCDFKCCIEKSYPISICQNSSWGKSALMDIDMDEIVSIYTNNPLTDALVIAGLEPFMLPSEIIAFVQRFRQSSLDDVIIYTGYNEDEIQEHTSALAQLPNIIIKYGRYIADQEAHKDPLLGVALASPNQYAVKIS